ncbi:MAG TPA: YiiX/YebB-like N1pC/P60 family cysteine hydrolase [Gemmatimonadales bacterium]
MFDRFGRALAGYLTRPATHPFPVTTSAPDALTATLRAGDVLLIEGDTRIAVAIKYLTQSSWSHAALCVADPDPARKGTDSILLEADVNTGVRVVPLEMYAGLHTRICRAVGLSADEIHRVIEYAVQRVGNQYDMKHIWDLARYLFPTPPVPSRWRRRLVALGSGDPTRAICSTLIAEAFQSIDYPILPEVILTRTSDITAEHSYAEMRHIQEHGLYMPRDFDVSPYFAIVKPTLTLGFDPHHRQVLGGTATTEEA